MQLILATPVLKILKLHASNNCGFSSGSARKIDLGFIMGASGARADADFALQKEVAKMILNSYDVSKDAVRVGVIVYGRSASLFVRLDYTRNGRRSILSSIDNLRLTSTGNNIDQALQLANIYMFSSRYGGRSGVPKVLIIFNNKPFDTSAFVAAKEALAKGYTIANIAIGDETRAGDGSKLTGREELALIVRSASEAPNAAQTLRILLQPGT